MKHIFKKIIILFSTFILASLITFPSIGGNEILPMNKSAKAENFDSIYHNPIDGMYKTDDFEYLRWGSPHLAFDCNNGIVGSQVYSIYDGTVYDIRYNDKSGNYIVIHHTAPDGTEFYSQYQHFAESATKTTGLEIGDPVSIGQVIGKKGETGNSQGEHLHLIIFEVLSGKMYQWPRAYDTVPLQDGTEKRLDAWPDREVCHENYLDVNVQGYGKIRYYNPYKLLKGEYIIGKPTDDSKPEFFEYKSRLYSEFAWYRGKDEKDKNGENVKHYVCDIPYEWKKKTDTSISESLVTHLTVLPSIAQDHYTTETFLIRDVYENAYGDIWYEVTTGGGQTGYIYSEDVEFVESRAQCKTHTGWNLPDGIIQKTNFGLEGSVDMTNRIARVEGRVVKTGYVAHTTEGWLRYNYATPEIVQEKVHELNGSTYQYSLAGNVIDQITFGTLDENCFYTFEFEVYCYCNDTAETTRAFEISTDFFVEGTNSPDVSSPEIGFISSSSVQHINRTQPASTIPYGNACELDGTITSGVNISYITGTVYSGDTVVLEPAVAPANGTYSNVKSVDIFSSEINTGLKFGTLNPGYYIFEIVVYYEGGSKIFSYPFEVVAKSVFPVEKITLNKTVVKMDATIDEMISLTASVEPNSATNPKVVWSNSNNQVVNMVSTDNTVEITAIGAGTSTITCTAADGSGAQASCTITVIKNEDDSNYEYCQTCWEWRPMYYGCEGNLHWTICEFCDTIDEYSYASHVGTCLNLRKCYLCGKETDNDISEIVHGNYIFTALGKVHGVYCGDCGAFLFYANHSTDDCSNKECICGVTVTNEYHIWHQDDSYEYYPDPDNQNQHYNPCDGCGEWFYSAHVNNEDAVGTVACSDCGAAYTVSCNHSETRYDINPSDSSEHISVCTLCGEIIAYSSESHNYIYQACSDDPMYHIGACPDCGYITNNVHQVNCWGEDALCDFCDAECQVGMYEMNHGYSLAKIDPTNPNLHILYCVYCETVFQREAHYRTCDQPTSDNSCSVCDAENVIDEKHYYWDDLTGDGNVCPDPYDDAQHMTWCLECSAFMGYSNHFAYDINNGVWYCVCGEPYTIEECDHPRNSQEIDWNNPDFFGYYEFHPDLNDSTLHYTFCYDCGTRITGEHVTACFDPNVCVFCGTSFTGSIAHNYKNGVCIYCGEKGIVESKLKLSEDSIALQINKNPTHTLTVAEMPNTVEADELIWVSSNPNVAAVQIGTVTALAEGTAVITCMTKDGLLSCSCSVTVSAWNILRLPAGLVRIDAESFMGIYANEVVLPDGIVSIGSKAFTDCKNLIRINMPDSLVSIAEDAFANCGDVVFICESDNAAASFAESHNISCEIGD